jgi:sporulation protein YlmC with PRC-barrel domain
MRRLLDNANIKYNVGGKEPIITANSTSLGCVGNVLLDIKIDRGKHLTVDALVVDNLSSNCLIAWKDMQRAGIISP